MSKMIRVSAETYEKIENIQSTLGFTKQAIVKKAVEKLDRDLLLAQTDLAFKKLKKNKKAWAEECAERAEFC